MILDIFTSHTKNIFLPDICFKSIWGQKTRKRRFADILITTLLVPIECCTNCKHCYQLKTTILMNSEADLINMQGNDSQLCLAWLHIHCDHIWELLASQLNMVVSWYPRHSAASARLSVIRQRVVQGSPGPVRSMHSYTYSAFSSPNLWWDRLWGVC